MLEAVNARYLPASAVVLKNGDNAARLAELVRGPREESIREARANLSGARAERSNAASDLERTREVFERGLSSADRMDAAETRFETAVAREQAANEALDRLLNGTTVEELQQAEAALRSAESQVRAARVDLDRTRVAAPSAGIIDKVLYELGKAKAVSGTQTLYDANRELYAKLRYGVKVLPDVGEQTVTIWLIDWENPAQNDFAVAEEVTVAAQDGKAHTKRPDIVLYVNGIAVGVIELKSSRVSLGDGIRTGHPQHEVLGEYHQLAH